jgi:hypothetical protein
MMIHPAHAPHSVPAIQPIDKKLHVITCISNPIRYHSRYRLYRSFEKHMLDSGVQLYTIECAFGDRPFEIVPNNNSNPYNPVKYIGVRTKEELWLKENLMNIAIQHLPLDAEYIACIDADFTFSRSDWAQETIQQLQHYQVVQMFSTVGYMNNNHEMIRHRLGYLQTYHNFLDGKNSAFAAANIPPIPIYPYPDGRKPGWIDVGAPGAAWAYRREAINHLGGLVDFCILGSGDYFMAAGLIGFMSKVVPNSYSPSLKAKLYHWATLAERNIRRNVGIVPGTVLHGWHGRLSERGYGSREKILINQQFDPNTDLKRDSQGVFQLEDDNTLRFIKLRDSIRNYFRLRNEDNIEE